MGLVGCAIGGYSVAVVGSDAGHITWYGAGMLVGAVLLVVSYAVLAWSLPPIIRDGIALVGFVAAIFAMPTYIGLLDAPLSTLSEADKLTTVFQLGTGAFIVIAWVVTKYHEGTEQHNSETEGESK